MKNLYFVIAFFISTGLFADGVHPSGVGTEEYPYQITSLDNLLWMSTNSGYWSFYYDQTSDIDASDTQTWNSGAGFIPIGNSSTKFSGHYNGQNHVIDGLYINRPSIDNQALFGYTNGAATIEHLGVTNVNIHGDSRCGGVAGYLTGTSYISNCYSTGSVSGISNVGGIAGIMFYNCGIYSSFTTCNVSASSSYAGGLVGTCRSTVTYSFSTGNVSGVERVGGLIGYAAYAFVTDSYSSSNVSSNYSYVGGLIGYNDNTYGIYNCYSTGLVNATAAYNGGLIGRNFNSTVGNSFWDMQTSGKTSSAAGTGKTSLEMKNVATYTDLTTVGLSTPWDFVGNPYNDASNMNYWDINSFNNSGYPFLSWQQFVPQVPQNVIISITSVEVTIMWDTAIGATSYKVYSSDTPYGSFTEDFSGIYNETSWIAPISPTKMFYYVIAVN
jgi:hypothetical protein